MDGKSSEEKRNQLQNHVNETNNEREKLKEELKAFREKIEKEKEDLEKENAALEKRIREFEKVGHPRSAPSPLCLVHPSYSFQEHSDLEEAMRKRQAEQGHNIFQLRKEMMKHLACMNEWKIFLDQQVSYAPFSAFASRPLCLHPSPAHQLLLTSVVGNEIRV